MADKAKTTTTNKSQKFTPEQYALHLEKQASRKASIIQNFMQLSSADQKQIKELLNSISKQVGKSEGSTVNKQESNSDKVASLVKEAKPKKIRNQVLHECAEGGSVLCQDLLEIFEKKTEKGSPEEAQKIMQWKIVPVIIETIRRSTQPNNFGSKEKELSDLMNQKVPTTEVLLNQLTTVARMMYPSAKKAEESSSKSGSDKPTSKN